MLKRETRILGLSGTTIRDRTIVVGVVFRGSLWLDGVLTSSLDTAEQNYNSEISRAIESSKQYPQLHAIILSRRLSRSRKISIRDLARRSRLPVIAIAKSGNGSRAEKRLRAVKNFGIVVSGKHLVVSAAGVDRAEAERLFGIGCTQGNKIPEAVRVADLLAEQLGELGRGLVNRQQNVKLPKATRHYQLYIRKRRRSIHGGRASPDERHS